MPTISIVIPIHDMKNGAFFLWRALNSIFDQSFKDYEIIITRDGKMAENTNAGIKKAKGELVKILYMDDYLAHPDVLKDIVEAMKDENWLITGCDTNPTPYYTEDIETGNNRLGSPSCLTMRTRMFFDETLSWLLDCDLYKRMCQLHGLPKILSGVHVIIGVGDHQMTNILTNEEKLSEHIYLTKKYENN